MKKKLAAAIAIALFASPALATNGLRMVAFSPLNASLGGAGAAFGMDSSALVLNPATLCDLGGRTDFGAAYFPTTIKYSATNSYLGTGVPALEGLGRLIVNQPGTEIESDFPAVPIPNIGLVIPFGQDLRLGVGMASMAGAGVDFPANLLSSTVQSTYLNFRFPIGASYRLLDGLLSLGASLNASWAMLGYSFGASAGLPPHPVASSFGIGFTLGAKVQLLPFLAIGLAYESPTWFQPFKYNIGPSSPLGAVPFPPGLPGGQEELQFNLPWSSTLGVQVTLLDGRLLLMGDVQYIPWSTTLGVGQPSFVNGSATATSQFFPFSTNWSDQWVFKVGVQGQLPGAADFVKLRAGFNYGKSPADPDRALENVAFPAIVESHLTLGAGFQVTKAIVLNLASVIGFANTVSGTAQLPDLAPIVGQPVPQGTFSSTISSSGYTLEAGVSVTF